MCHTSEVWHICVKYVDFCFILFNAMKSEYRI